MDEQATARRGNELPEGVEIREGSRGTRLRVTFTWQGARRRETLNIPATPANIKYAARLRGEVQNAIERGTFDYAATFPNSKYARLTVKVQQIYSVNKLIEDYLDTARKTKSLSPSSIGCYDRWYKSRLQGQFAGKFLHELNTPELRKWIADLSVELAPKSVRNCVGLLSTVLNQAAGDGLIPINPLTPIKLRTLLPKKQKAGDDDKIDPFNSDEIAAILAACRSPNERALFQFAFATGMRTGELIAFKWEHIDWLQGSLHVQDNVVYGEGFTVEKTTKTDCERDIPILPGAKAALDTMKPISQLLKIGGYVFTPDGLNRWRDDHQIRQRWTTILRRAGVRYRNPYQTRHTFASTLLMNGERELLVAELLGHNSVEMVRRHYGKYIKQPGGIVLRSEYRELGANLGQVESPKPALSLVSSTGTK